MIPVSIAKRKRGGRIANRPVLREFPRLNGRNESAFEKVVRRILVTVVTKTIHFAETNRACGDKQLLKLPKRRKGSTRKARYRAR